MVSIYHLNGHWMDSFSLNQSDLSLGESSPISTHSKIKSCRTYKENCIKKKTHEDKYNLLNLIFTFETKRESQGRAKSARRLPNHCKNRYFSHLNTEDGGKLGLGDKLGSKTQNTHTDDASFNIHLLCAKCSWPNNQGKQFGFTLPLSTSGAQLRETTFLVFLPPFG